MKHRSRTERIVGEPADSAMRLASSIPEPRVDSLIVAVPDLLRAVRKRRHAATAPAERIATAGRYWIPRLAPLTAVLVALALISSAGTERSAANPSRTGNSLDGWLLTGSDGSDESDPLVHALIGTTPAERRR